MAETGSQDGSRPPYSNRGVYPLIVEGSSRPDFPVFDAYCATVHAHHDLVLDRLEDALEASGTRCRREEGPPIRFYAGNALLVDEKGHRLAQVRHGGQNPHPFVEAKGDTAAVVAETLREHFSHMPSRIDSAVDRAAPGLFEELADLARRFEAVHGLKYDTAGARFEHQDRGSTIYLGSRKSQVFVRIYQKGLKLAEEMGLAGSYIPASLRDWVRVEVEFKPQKKRARTLAARLDARAIWGTSLWLAEFATEALSIEAERVQVNERRESDHERALRFMASQYRSHLDQLLTDCQGDYAAAFEVLVELADLAPRKAA